MCLISIFLIGTYIGLKIRYPLKYESIIELESKANSLDSSLVEAVIWTESKFKPNAVSKSGAVGLMQLMPKTAEWCAELLGIDYNYELLISPNYNIKLGTYYLNYLLNKFDTVNAIAAYNAGEGNVSKWISSSLKPSEYPIKETRDYIERVFDAKKKYNYINKIS